MSSKKKSSSESGRASKSARTKRTKPTAARRSTSATKLAGPVAPTSQSVRAEGLSNVLESSTALARTTANIAALRKQLKPATDKSARKSSDPHEEILNRALDQLETGYRNLLGGS